MSRRLPTQFVEQRFRLFEIGGVEPFGEPAVDLPEKLAGFGGATLVAPQARKARGGAQFPGLASCSRAMPRALR